MRPDPPLPLVFTAAQAEARGVSRRQADGRLTRGLWHRLERGVFCTTPAWEEAGEIDQHLLRARAALLAGNGSPLVLSHVSAAAAHRLPVFRRSLERVALTLPPAAGRRPRRTTTSDIHVARLDDGDVIVVDGLPLTALARTLADCMRHLPPEQAVAIADAALRRRTAAGPDVTREQLAEVLRRQSGWPFAAVGRLALALTDPRRETPLESRSAVVMHQHALPPPVPQVAVYDERGRFVARVDFAWLDRAVVGEADGRVKYGADAARVIAAEKDRQARLEALGLVVVRWEERHLHGDPPPMVQRLGTALAAGHAGRFRGQAA